MGNSCPRKNTNQVRQSYEPIKIRTHKKKPKIGQKVVFLGDAGVGKTCIAQRFCYNKFSSKYEVTIGGVYHKKDVTLENGEGVTLHLWDTAGQEKLRSMTPLYYRDADAAILVYDVTSSKSLESLSFWLYELDTKVRNDGMILILAGNKCDINNSDRKVKRNIGKQFADANNLIFYEISALTEEGIQEMFNAVAEECYKRKLIPQNHDLST